MNKSFQGTYKTWSTPVSKQKSKLIPCNLCGGQRFVKALDCEGFSFVRCTQCGLLQSNPQVETDEVSARYRELHGAEYLAYELENEGPFLGLQELALRDVDFSVCRRERFWMWGAPREPFYSVFGNKGGTLRGLNFVAPRPSTPGKSGP